MAEDLTDEQADVVDTIARQLANIAFASMESNGIDDATSASITALGTAFAYGVAHVIQNHGVPKDTAIALAHTTVDEAITTILSATGSAYDA